MIYNGNWDLFRKPSIYVTWGYQMAKRANLYNQHPDTVMLYSANWCPDCRRARAYLDEKGIAYDQVDTARDPKAYEFLEKILRRVRLPALFFPDGSMAVEPTNEELERHLLR